MSGLQEGPMRLPGLGCLFLCGLLAVAGLHLGVRSCRPVQVWAALTGEGRAPADIIIRDLSLPRMVLSMLVGATLGLAGLLMQSLTRNPFAEPGLLGVIAGAVLAVATLITLQPGAGQVAMMTVAALGALGAATLVFGLAVPVGRDEASPMRLLMAGVTVAALAGTGGSLCQSSARTAACTRIPRAG